MNIAIIGSGISGLTAAYRLSREHPVTVFEANNYIGGHTQTTEIQYRGESHAIDSGFIVFNEKNYPNFTRLLRELDVPWQPTSMSFSVRCERTGLEYNGSSLSRLFSQRSNLFKPSFLRMIRDILRFNRQALRLTAEGDAATVAQFVRRHRFSREFANHYLIPMGASIWSCPPRKFWEFPVRFVVEFMKNHGLLQIEGRPRWQVIRGGSARYVEKLVHPFRRRIRLNCPVASVTRDTGHVRIVDGSGREGFFDHVVFACHSDQAQEILQDPSPVERDLLGAFAYHRNTAVLHTDTSKLPADTKAWASWNYRIPRGDADQVSVTYNMNILQSLESNFVFNVSLNDRGRLDPDKTLRRFEYDHPLFGPGRNEAQRRHSEVIDQNRTSFCGAYWGYGFHEDGVNSALSVCNTLQRRQSS